MVPSTSDNRVTKREPQTDDERAGVRFNIANPDWVTKDLSQTCRTIRASAP